MASKEPSEAASEVAVGTSEGTRRLRSWEGPEGLGRTLVGAGRASKGAGPWIETAGKAPEAQNQLEGLRFSWDSL